MGAGLGAGAPLKHTPERGSSSSRGFSRGRGSGRARGRGRGQIFKISKPRPRIQPREKPRHYRDIQKV